MQRKEKVKSWWTPDRVQWQRLGNMELPSEDRMQWISALSCSDWFLHLKWTWDSENRQYVRKLSQAAEISPCQNWINYWKLTNLWRTAVDPPPPLSCMRVRVCRARVRNTRWRMASAKDGRGTTTIQSVLFVSRKGIRQQTLSI